VRIGAIAVAVVLACRYFKCSVAACWRCINAGTSLGVQSAAGILKPLRKAPSRCCCVVKFEVVEPRAIGGPLTSPTWTTIVLVVVHRKGLSDFYEHVLAWLGAVGTLLFVPFGVALVLQFGFASPVTARTMACATRSPV
jgi:hypothetical protein